MSKLLLSALLVAVLVVPAIQAQVPGAAPGYTLDVQITDLPASIASNGTQVSVPFNVTATISGASSCLGAANSGSFYTIELSAELVNSTGSSTFVNVNPRQHTIAGPVAVPSAGGGSTRKSPATLLVDAGPYSGDSLNATVKVTATFEGSNGGCTGTAPAPADSDEATLRAGFTPAIGYGEPADSGQKMPGAGLGLSLVALAAVVLLARRK